MPILDNLRLGQIREAMNYEQNMQRQAFDIIKRGVTVMDPEVPESAPYNPVNPDDVQSMEELINNLLQLLEQKYNDIDSSIRGQSLSGSIDNIALVEDVLTSYNRVVSVLINPNSSQQTKNALSATVMKIETYVVGIEELCEQALNGIARSPNIQAITFYFMKILKAYTAYNLIHKQMSSQNFVIITQRDLDDNLEMVLRQHRNWNRVIRENNLGHQSMTR